MGKRSRGGKLPQTTREKQDKIKELLKEGKVEEAARYAKKRARGIDYTEIFLKQE